jgi:hypothetical protein
MAGTLKRLGHHIPQPEKAADEANPRGYYESSWVATFHSRWFKDLRVRAIDTRPEAGAIVLAELTAEREQRLCSWLQRQAAERGPDEVMVVKEVRAFWVYPLWQRAAAAAGVDLVALTMLRHPAQVVRSNDTAYLTGRPDAVRLQRETTNVAAWVNALLTTERATRSSPRAFVRYVDLVADWRAAVMLASPHLGLDHGDLTGPHPVDDFVSASLNRSADSWDGLAVPTTLRDLADRAWSTAETLVERPHDPDTLRAFDALREEYDDLHTSARALAADAADAQLRELRLRLKARLERKDEEIARLRAELAQRSQGPGSGK